ncbi:MAG: UvrD-helicase domain-containing protein, partial [Desulfomonile sp.]|nr:UvrD-helicase domain-containing protein [Desulfomonile sp.]
GHRKCSVRLDPKQTAELDGRCPVCGHPVTVGVMNRVMELGTRPEGVATERSAPFWRVVPLAEIISQGLGVGVQSKKVGALYREIIGTLGPELMILWAAPLETVALHVPEIVVEGIARMRRGEVYIQAGYDGEYGTVRLFTDAERHHFGGQQALLPVDRVQPRGRSRHSTEPVRKCKRVSADDKSEEPAGPELNDEQRAAVSELGRPVIVRAGPGTGKTRTLTLRAAYLMERGVAPTKITAVTFTRKAAAEMQSRLETLVSPEAARECWVGTFHQLALRVMDRFIGDGVFLGRGLVLDRDEALGVFREAAKLSRRSVFSSAVGLFDRVGLLKQDLVEPDNPGLDDEVSAVYQAYEQLLEKRQALDLDDLVRYAVRLLVNYPDQARRFREEYAEHLLVDEFQDVNRGQYELVKLLTGPSASGLFVIGDPNQAIYGFRGADLRYFALFGTDYPEAVEVGLVRNYRSQATILDAAQCVLNVDQGRGRLVPTKPAGTPIRIVRLPNAATEGIFITRTIDDMLGGASFLSVDSGIAGRNSSREFGLSDFAVLFRLNAVGDALEDAFQSAGIPCQRARKDNPQDEAEAIDRRVQAVSLMTIHAAKGLEFPVVFIAGCEDGVLPYEPPGGGEMDEDEERRLLYVAMTRAETVLCLTGAAARNLFGRTCRSPLSRFVRAIDRNLCCFESPLEGRRQDELSNPVQCELF